MIPLLALRDVHAGYDAIEVLHGVSVHVDAGEVVVLLGANGAGKSTLLSVASGMLVPTAGQLLVAGQDLTGTGAGDLARAGICTVPEGRSVFPSLTVAEHLLMMTHRGVSAADVEERAYARFPRLADRRQQLAGDLSGGEQQMLALARAVATEPSVVLVDELSMGLAPIIVAELFALLRGLADEGVAVLVVEQMAQAALDTADRAAVVANGRITHEGDPERIRSVIADAYLGVDPLARQETT